MDWFGFIGYGVYIDCCVVVDNDFVSCDGFFWLCYEVLVFFEFVCWYY